MKYTFAAIVVKEDRFYVAHCPDLGVTSQRISTEESIDNLKEAVSLYLKDEEINDLVPASNMPPILTTIEISV